MRFCIFEDAGADELLPLTLTRPFFDLWSGCGPLDERLKRYFERDHAGYLVRPEMADVARELRPTSPVNEAAWLRDGATLLVNSRWVPPAGILAHPLPRTSCLGVIGNEVAFAVLMPEQLRAVSPLTLEDNLSDWFTSLALRDVGGWMIQRPADLLRLNDQLIQHDFERQMRTETATPRFEGVQILGSQDHCHIAVSAVLEPWVLLDTRNGPIKIGEGVHVSAFSELRGPCVVGARSRVRRACILGGTTLGEECFVEGTVERSIALNGFQKKSETLLRDSYLGKWVEQESWTVITGATVADHAHIGSGVHLREGTKLGLFSRIESRRNEKEISIGNFEDCLSDGTREPLLPSTCLKLAEVVTGRAKSPLGKAQLTLYRQLLQGSWESPETLPATLYRAAG